MRSRWPSVFSPLTQDLGKKELRTQQAVHHDEKNGTACCSNTTAPLSKMTSWTGQPPGSRARVREILCEGLRGRAFHVMGSFQTSAAHCESLASKLKEYGASGVTASRAVLKSILWEANPESSEAFILRVWAEVMGGSLSFFNRRGQKRRKERFPLGLGSKTLHGLILARNKQKQTKTRFLDFKRIRKLRKVWMAAAKEIWTGRSKPRSAAAAGRASLRAWLDVGSKRMRTAY